MPHASLTDLPTELLVNIFEQPTLSSETLYSSALLCRRLHLIALPIYFSRNGVDLENKSAIIELHPVRLDPLSALQICLFISSMKHISCVFPHPSCAASLDALLMQLRRLRAFISRLSAVETVILNLDSIHSHSWCQSIGNDKVLKKWARHYGGLLSCIVNAGCTSLTVINGAQLTETYRAGPHWSKLYLPLAIRRLLFPLHDSRPNGFKRRRSQGTKNIRLSASLSPCFSHLTSLHLLSTTLIVPPGLDWTLSVLHHCPITTLSIHMFRIKGDTRMRRTVLPLMAAAAPNLTTVSLIEVHHWDQEAAISFVAQLPHITDLTLDFATPHVRQWPSSALKALINLRAPPAVVDDLFFDRDSLPSIQSIAMIWEPSTHPYPDTLIDPISSIA
ncbi:hypothetical protein MSAN_01890100 [Mycena sanguinolenta]|uniref:F-box domain-containing protein n=1 Tax=Mycena sanguinolenta TaxID=230812 RepID=A0A8H6XRR8_9AGAR|nr:hypothetical protein MSAN_01890100 [Mycena sanguinolenta]